MLTASIPNPDENTQKLKRRLSLMTQNVQIFKTLFFKQMNR